VNATFTDIVFSEVNIALTILLIVFILYWIITMIGGIDFDLDIDVDVDVDVDADFEPNIEGGTMDFEDVSNVEVNKDHVVNKRRSPLKAWQIFLIYFNFVGLPFMFTLTCWVFIWWSITTLTTALTLTYDNALGFVIVFVAFIPALFINKLITTPLKGFFKHLNKDGDVAVDFLGRKATLLSSISGDKMGNAEVLADGNAMSVYVKSLSGEALKYGSTVLIIKQSADQNYYLVENYND